jgi:hypothetical protein
LPIYATVDRRFRRQWQHRILNIHPALLPAFKGLDTHRRALEAGVNVHGATVHFVVPEMDFRANHRARGGQRTARREREALAARVFKLSTKSIPWRSNWLQKARVNTTARCLIDGGTPLPDQKSGRRYDYPRCSSTDMNSLSARCYRLLVESARPPSTVGNQMGDVLWLDV